MSNQPPPRISVLIPAYNAERYLRASLASIFAQQEADFECIVVNDGSMDGTQKILDEIAKTEPRLHILSRPNTGIVGALNDGLAYCRGQYIARMDADDLAAPERLTRQAHYLDSHPTCVGVGAWVEYIDPDGDHIWTWQMSTNAEDIREALLNGSIGGLVHPVMMLRRDALESVGGYRQGFDDVEDYELFVRLLDHGEFAVLPECLLSYRQHPLSVNATRSRAHSLEKINHILAEVRPHHNLPPLQLTITDQKPTEILLHWVDLALQEFNWCNAIKTTKHLLRTEPLSSAPWQAMTKIARAYMAQIRIKVGARRHSSNRSQIAR